MKHKNSSLKEYNIRINKVLDYINNNYAEKINLLRLSEESCFSPFHFHRIFTSIVKETPNNYISRIRIEKAANLLLYFPHLSITEIAFKCGFDSSASFARSFKTYFDISASEWRKKNSKICKDEGNIWKTFRNHSEYISGEIKIISQQNEVYEMNIQVKTMPTLTLAYVAHHEGYNSKIHKAFDKLCSWAGPRGLLAGDVKVLGISWDNPDITPIDKCRYYACITVPDNTEVKDDIGLYKMPSSKCIIMKYQGKDDGIKGAYEYIYNTYLPGSGFQPADIPCYEIYFKSPDDEPVGEFDMDICIPVRPL